MPESAADIRTKWTEFGPSDLSGSKDYRLSGLCAVLGDLEKPGAGGVTTSDRLAGLVLILD